MRYRLGEKEIRIKGKNFFIADSAVVIGDVTIDNNVSIWYNVVVRGDIGSIEIGEGSNIQDGSVLHNDEGVPLVIGKGVTVGHKAVLHSCTIGDNTLIGMNAVILTNAKVGNNCIVGANTFITQEKEIPDNSLVIGSPGKVVRELTEEEIQGIRENAEHYIRLFKQYKKDLIPD